MTKITYDQFVEELRANLPDLEAFAKQGMVGVGLVRQHKEAIRMWDAAVICGRASAEELKIYAKRAEGLFKGIHPHQYTWHLNLYRSEVPEMEACLLAGTVNSGTILVRQELIRLLVAATTPAAL